MDISLSVSIAMCTYNGARFLSEQLASFANQTRQPNEVVICDDCSTDNTVEILRQWAKTVPFAVKIVQNEKNLGYGKNFVKATTLCTSDIIFFSDQDDVWESKKLETVLAVFESKPEIGAVICDGLCVDSQGKSLNRLASEISSPAMLYGEPYYFYWNPIRQGMLMLGCCCAVRNSVWTKVLPMPDSFAHDFWSFLAISAVSKIEYLPDTLTHYRLHENNTSAVTPNSNSNMTGSYFRTYYKTATGLYFYLYAKIEDFRNWLMSQTPTCQTKAALAFLKSEDRHYNNRSRCQRNIYFFFPLWIWEILSGGYCKRHQPIQSMIYDCYCGSGLSRLFGTKENK